MDEVGWYYYLNGQQNGPISRAQLSILVASGEVPLDTLIWSPELTNWTPAQAVPAFAALRAAPAAVLSVPPAAGQQRLAEASTDDNQSKLQGRNAVAVAATDTRPAGARVQDQTRQAMDRVAAEVDDLMSTSDHIPAFNSSLTSEADDMLATSDHVPVFGSTLMGKNDGKAEASELRSLINQAAQPNAGQSKWGDLDSIGRTPTAGGASQQINPAPQQSNPIAQQSTAQNKWGDLDSIGRTPTTGGASQQINPAPQQSNPTAQQPGPSKWGDLDSIGRTSTTGGASQQINPTAQQSTAQNKWGDLDSIGRTSTAGGASQQISPAPQQSNPTAQQPGPSKWGDLDSIGRTATTGGASQQNNQASQQSTAQSRWGDLDSIGRPSTAGGASQQNNQAAQQSNAQSKWGDLESIGRTSAPGAPAQQNNPAPQQSTGQSKWGDLDSIGRTSTPGAPAQQNNPAPQQSNPSVQQPGPSKWGDLDSIGRTPTAGGGAPQQINPTAQQSTPSSQQSSGASKWGDLDSIGRKGGNSVEQNRPASIEAARSSQSASSAQQNITSSAAEAPGQSRWGDLDSIGRKGGNSVEQNRPASIEAARSLQSASSAQQNITSPAAEAPAQSKWGDLESIGRKGGNSVEQNRPASIEAARSLQSASGQQEVTAPGTEARAGSPAQSKWGDLDSIGRKGGNSIEQNRPASIEAARSLQSSAQKQEQADALSQPAQSKWGDLDSIGRRGGNSVEQNRPASIENARTTQSSQQHNSVIDDAFSDALSTKAGSSSSDTSQVQSKWGDLDSIVRKANNTSEGSRPASIEAAREKQSAKSGQATWQDLKSTSKTQSDNETSFGSNSVAASWGIKPELTGLAGAAAIADAELARRTDPSQSEPQPKPVQQERSPAPANRQINNEWGDLNSIKAPGAKESEGKAGERNTAEAARTNPELFHGCYLKNPYRVLGLTGTTSQSDLKKTVANIRRQAKIGKSHKAAMDLQWCGPVQRSERDLLEAETKLLNPDSRLQSRLLWFHDTRDLPADLTARSAGELAETWAAAGDPISLHDAAVLMQFAAIADSPECKREEYWKRSIELWNAVLADDRYWDLLCDLDDQLGFEPVCLSSDVFAQRDSFITLVTEPLVALSKDALNSGARDIFARTAKLLNKNETADSSGGGANSDLVDEFFRLVDGASKDIDNILQNKIQRNEKNDDKAKLENVNACRQCEEIYKKQIAPVITNAQSVLSQNDPILLQLRSSAADMLDAIASGYSWTDDLDSAIRLLHQAEGLGIGTSSEPKIREHLTSIETSKQCKELFANDKPIKSAPALFTINTIGCAIYPALGEKPDPVVGAQRGIYYFVFLMIPIFPLACYRVIFQGPGRGYRFMSKLPLDKWARIHQIVAVFSFFMLVMSIADSSAKLEKTHQAAADERIRLGVSGIKENRVVPTEKYDLKSFISEDDRILETLTKQLDSLKADAVAKEELLKTSTIAVQNAKKSGMDKSKLEKMISEHNKMVDEYEKILASGKARFAFYQKVLKERNGAADTFNNLYARR